MHLCALNTMKISDYLSQGHKKKPHFCFTIISGVFLYHLTPFYDVLSTHPIIGSGRNQIAAPKIKLAMAVRGSKNYYFINQIQRHHWRKQAELVGLGAVLADTIIDEVIAATPRVIT